MRNTPPESNTHRHDATELTRASNLRANKWACASLLLLFLISLLLAFKQLQSSPDSSTLSITEEVGSTGQGYELAQTHDFGVVRPNTTIEHPYSIQNLSNSDWHVVEVIPQCSCSAAEPSGRLIRPGMELILRVTIQIADEERDLRRSVSVRIMQDGTERKLEFVALASVRRACSVNVAPNTLRFVGHDEQKSIALTVSNFSSERWQSVEVTSVENSDASQHDVPEITSLRRRDAADRKNESTALPIEIWSGVVPVHESDLRGATRRRLDFLLTAKSADGITAEQRQISVDCSKVDPVVVYPPTFLFPYSHSDRRVTRKATIVFNGSTGAPDVLNVEQIGFPAEVILNTDWRRRSEKIGELAVTFAADAGATSSFRGELQIGTTEPRVFTKVQVRIDYVEK